MELILQVEPRTVSEYSDRFGGYADGVDGLTVVTVPDVVTWSFGDGLRLCATFADGSHEHLPYTTFEGAREPDAALPEVRDAAEVDL